MYMPKITRWILRIFLSKSAYSLKPVRTRRSLSWRWYAAHILGCSDLKCASHS